MKVIYKLLLNMDLWFLKVSDVCKIMKMFSFSFNYY